MKKIEKQDTYPVIVVERMKPNGGKPVLVSIDEEVWEKAQTVDDIVQWMIMHRDALHLIRHPAFFTDHLEFPAEQISIQLHHEDTDEILAVFDEVNIAAVGATAEEAKENLKAAIEERYRHMISKRDILSERLFGILERLERLGIPG
jgi:predicted RNase H-like HicB family nuclease